MDVNNPKRLKKPNEQTDLEKSNCPKSCNKPKNVLSTREKEKSMSLLDVQHIKNLQNPLSRTQVEALKDIHHCWKGS